MIVRNHDRTCSTKNCRFKNFSWMDQRAIHGACSCDIDCQWFVFRIKTNNKEVFPVGVRYNFLQCKINLKGVSEFWSHSHSISYHRDPNLRYTIGSWRPWRRRDNVFTNNSVGHVLLLFLLQELIPHDLRKLWSFKRMWSLLSVS